MLDVVTDVANWRSILLQWQRYVWCGNIFVNDAATLKRIVDAIGLKPARSGLYLRAAFTFESIAAVQRKRMVKPSVTDTARTAWKP